MGDSQRLQGDLSGLIFWGSVVVAIENLGLQVGLFSRFEGSSSVVESRVDQIIFGGMLILVFVSFSFCATPPSIGPFNYMLLQNFR